MNNPATKDMPKRFERPSFTRLLFTLFIVWLLVKSFQGANVSVTEIINGLPSMQRILGEMFPPTFSRIGAITEALLVTFQMGIAGTFIGVILSLPLGILASRSQTPNKITYTISRLLVSLFRTVPDLVWALFFVVTVGLGPFAGVLTIIVDTIGFCGRFFAEGIEEVDPRPIDALKTLGASRLSVISAGVIPEALPSLINSSLFSLEKAVRSSVVLGLVGAGGIGIELKVSMDTFRYSEASAIILLIFALVVLVEYGSSRLRKKIIN